MINDADKGSEPLPEFTPADIGYGKRTIKSEKRKRTKQKDKLQKQQTGKNEFKKR